MRHGFKLMAKSYLCHKIQVNEKFQHEAGGNSQVQSKYLVFFQVSIVLEVT